MFRYSGYSLTIESELELPELAQATGDPDVLFRLGRVPRVVRLATMTEELAFHGLAGAFHIRNGREIVIDPLPSAEPELLRTVLLGRMMAYLLRQRGWLALHASGVTIGGVGVLFLGASGCGKSTTAAAFYARGHVVITDDVAPVRVSTGDCLGLVRPRLRLDERSRSILNDRALRGAPEWDKYAYNLPDARALPPSARIQRIYALTDGQRVAIQALSNLASFRLLSAHSFFKRRKMERAAIENHLSLCAAVAMSTSVHELLRPKDLRALPTLVEAVERDVTRG
jgi:hypothetical protein